MGNLAQKPQCLSNQERFTEITRQTHARSMELREKRRCEALGALMNKENIVDEKVSHQSYRVGMKHSRRQRKSSEVLGEL